MASTPRELAPKRPPSQTDGLIGCIGYKKNANTDLRVGLCLSVVDLFMSKAWAGRDKDREFCIGLLRHAFVKLEDALAMVHRMPLDESQHRTLTRRIKRWAA